MNFIFKVTLGDGLPEFICHECVQKLNVSHAFRKQCITNDVYLRSLLVTRRDKDCTTRTIMEDKSVISDNCTYLSDNRNDDKEGMEGETEIADVASALNMNEMSLEKGNTVSDPRRNGI